MRAAERSCDVVLVDGDHGFVGTYRDLRMLQRASSSTTAVVVDDVVPQCGEMLGGIDEADATEYCARPAAKGKGKAAPPAKTIAKKPLKLVKIPTSALAERAKSKGRAIKAAAPFEHPDAEKVPQPRKSPPKKAAPPANEAVKEALKKVSTILAECIKSL